jgi:hypothetical protein
MKTWKTGLRALSHPLTLTSIGLLVLNDHALKQIYPSVLTGKLSDFAGLFFFPYLLAFFLSLGLNWTRISSRGTAIFSFGLTIFWFTAIKTWQPANLWTAALASRILGYPTQITLDPSDLIALTVLWPSWQLWKHIDNQKVLTSRFTYLALGFASLATMATQPCLPQVRILKVVVMEQKFYTKGFYEYTTDSFMDQIQVSKTGKDWTAIEESEVPETVRAKLAEPANYPETICVPDQPNICYRTGKPDQLEMSEDGGNTWKTGWRIPIGRRTYMERYLSSKLLSCKKSPDEGPYDLALIPQNGGNILVAAMGNEGVLVKNLDGTWERVGMLNAEPTPFQGDGNLFVLLFETATWIALAAISWQIFSFWGISLSIQGEDAKKQRRQARAPLWLGIVISVVSILSLPFLVNIRGFGEALLFFMIALAIISFFTGSLISWNRAIKGTPYTDMARKIRTVSMLIPWGIFPGAWLPYLGWAYGIVPVYALALILSLILTVLSIVYARIKILQVVNKAQSTT